MDKVAVVIRRDEEVLLLKNEDRDEWSPIISEVQRGETFREAARRRTTSIVEAGIEFVEKLDREDISDGERIHWYLATEESSTEENPNPQKVDADGEKLSWFRPEEIESLEIKSVSKQFFQEFTDSLIE